VQVVLERNDDTNEDYQNKRQLTESYRLRESLKVGNFRHRSNRFILMNESMLVRNLYTKKSKEDSFNNDILLQDKKPKE